MHESRYQHSKGDRHQMRHSSRPLGAYPPSPTGPRGSYDGDANATWCRPRKPRLIQGCGKSTAAAGDDDDALDASRRRRCQAHSVTQEIDPGDSRIISPRVPSCPTRRRDRQRRGRLRRQEGGPPPSIRSIGDIRVKTRARKTIRLLLTCSDDETESTPSSQSGFVGDFSGIWSESWSSPLYSLIINPGTYRRHIFPQKRHGLRYVTRRSLAPSVDRLNVLEFQNYKLLLVIF